VRFSKVKVTEQIQASIDAIQSVHRFDPANGYAQVMGKETDKQVAYGQWYALRGLAENLGLLVDPRNPRRWKP
jgi:hypothetical protein